MVESRESAILRFQRDVLACDGNYRELLACILANVSRLTVSDGACLEMMQGDEMVYEATTGIAAPFVGLRIKIEESLSGFSVKTNALMRCNNTEMDDRVDHAACRKIGIGSMLIVPLHYDQQTLGVLKVMCAAANAFYPQDEETLELVAGFIGATIGRKHAEMALREYGERFHTLADNMAQLAWTTDNVGNILWYNRRWFEYTGTTLEQMQTEGWQIVHHPAHFERVYRKWCEAITNGKTWEDTFPIRGADGRFRWFLSRAVPIRDEHQRVTKWFGTNTDITDQREAEESLRRAKEVAEAASKTKDAFIAALSHELRTPLSPVLLITEELMADRRLPDEAHDQLAVVRRNVALEARLIDDLLDIARITQGKLVMHLSACDAHELLNYALEIVESDRDARALQLNRYFEASNHFIYADSARIQQVFWNVLKNAIKFTEPGGRVDVRTFNRPDGSLVVEVSDTGRGIEPAMSDAIFAPFEQAGLANDHRFGGLGLGLAICRAVMRLHGGTIKATSEGIDHGATFHVELATIPHTAPAPKRTDRFNGEAHSASWLAGDAGDRLLLVEDHEPTLAVLDRLLKRKGYNVTTAASFVGAMEAATNHQFDILISDIGLPDGSGYELLPRLRALQPTLRGIALTGYGADEDRAKSVAAGFVTHLTKPVDFGELQRALSSVH